MKLSDHIRSVTGIGPKKAEKLYTLGIITVGDALSYYPRDYEDRTRVTSIREGRAGEKILLQVVIGSTPQAVRVRKGHELTKCRVFDASGTMELIWFHNPYVAQSLQVSGEYYFYGRLQPAQGHHLTMINPEWEPVGRKNGLSGRILPIYPLCAGITHRDIEQVVGAALSIVPENQPDWIPEDLIRRNGLLSGTEALRLIHRPQTMNQAREARRRLVFEELFLLSCGMQKIKARRQKMEGIILPDTDLTEFYSTLPFTPTGSQRRAIEDCAQDLASSRPMNRLIQGDVGSGKTLVAAAACYLAAKNGVQSAVMVPTEILARQHAVSMSQIFKKLGISFAVLTASMGTKIKREVQAAAENGEISVLIGTHALIQDNVHFSSLGLMVADEQHRFGVRQRAELAQKGHNCNIMVMSATPIPRSLALMLYGDLDLSVINELPPGRQRIRTFGVGEKMRSRIYAFIEKQCTDGGQVYVVCPAVEENELEIENAEDCAEKLKKIFPNRRIGLLHGRLKGTEKDQVMTEFTVGNIDILVSTTVIEVGVNVPNATLMVVENADRFGLSQLHQLRGRVGRGTRPSYAVFFGADKGEKARERLKILCETNDGFQIARADLELRGPGDLFGNRQHGETLFKLTEQAWDMELIESARLGAEVVLELDPDLTENLELRKQLKKMFGEEKIGLWN